MPQRPPASIDMLHNVMRPSIDSAAMALPANSTAWPWRAVGADARDDRKRDVLGADAGGRLAAHGHAHALRLFLPQRLRHQNVRHLGRADAEGVSAEGAVGRGVAVAADDEQAGQCEALFRADDVHDALARIAQAEKADAIFGSVGLEIGDHRRDRRIGNRAVAGVRRNVVIGDAEGESRLGHRPPAFLQLA